MVCLRACDAVVLCCVLAAYDELRCALCCCVLWALFIDDMAFVCCGVLGVVMICDVVVVVFVYAML